MVDVTESGDGPRKPPPRQPPGPVGSRKPPEPPPAVVTTDNTAGALVELKVKIGEIGQKLATLEKRTPEHAVVDAVRRVYWLRAGIGIAAAFVGFLFVLVTLVALLYGDSDALQARALLSISAAVVLGLTLRASERLSIPMSDRIRLEDAAVQRKQLGAAAIAEEDDASLTDMAKEQVSKVAEKILP